MQKTETKAIHLLEPLFEEIGNFQSGDRFYSIRELMHRFHVSQLVIDKAVARLCATGLLESVPRKGLFIPQTADVQNKKQPAYLVAVPSWPSPDIDEMIQALEAEKYQYGDKRLLFHRYDYRQAVPAELPITFERVAGVVLMPGGINTMEVEDIAALRAFQNKVPIVVLCHHLDHFKFPSIGLDDNFAGNLAAHHLAGLGHRKIGILVSEPSSSVISDRINGILNYARLHDMDVQIIDCGIISGETTMQKTYDTMSETLKMNYDFTALIGISASSFGEALNACHNNEVNIPRDLSVVAIGNISSAGMMHPPIDVVSTELTAQFHMALRMLITKENGNKLISPKLIKGESTCRYAG